MGVLLERKGNKCWRQCLPGQVFLSFFFSPLCCRAENREEIQTKITPVPLPEKCVPVPSRYPPCSEGKVKLRQLGGV